MKAAAWRALRRFLRGPCTPEHHQYLAIGEPWGQLCDRCGELIDSRGEMMRCKCGSCRAYHAGRNANWFLPCGRCSKGGE